MILSLVTIALFGIAVGAWLYLDTRYQTRSQRWTRRAANLAIFDERVSESDQQDAKLRAIEAEHLLLNEVTDDEVGEDQRNTSFLFQVGGSVLVCVCGFLGYVILGDLDAPELEHVAQRIEELPNMEVEQREKVIATLIRQLERRNNSARGDVASSDYLIFMHSLNRDLESVIRTHELAEQRSTTSIMSDLERIQAEVLSNGELTKVAQRVAERVLAEVPDQPSIMQLYGVAAFRTQNYQQARNFFERGIRNTTDPSRARLLEELVNRTNEQLSEDHVGIRVDVNVQLSLAPDTNLWLTVFAESDGESLPLAVVQRPFVRPAEYKITLDDAVAMLPQYLLSDADQIRVVARLTPTQDISSTDAIQEVSSGWLDPKTNPKVALHFTDMTTEDSITVSVNLGENIIADDEATIFIIGRSLANETRDQPLIIKRVLKRDLPLDLRLTVEDAMLKLDHLPAAGLEVYARLSRTGNSTRAINDVESNLVPVKVGQSARLTLDRVIQEGELLKSEVEKDP